MISHWQTTDPSAGLDAGAGIARTHQPRGWFAAAFVGTFGPGEVFGTCGDLWQVRLGKLAPGAVQGATDCAITRTKAGLPVADKWAQVVGKRAELQR